MLTVEAPILGNTEVKDYLQCLKQIYTRLPRYKEARGSNSFNVEPYGEGICKTLNPLDT
jgi:hypothetical protein